jgi:hypothetical protein
MMVDTLYHSNERADEAKHRWPGSVATDFIIDIWLRVIENVLVVCSSQQSVYFGSQIPEGTHVRC